MSVCHLSLGNMFQKTDFDVDLCVKHLKQIAIPVQCPCSALYLNAYTCECGHSLCDSCWKAKRNCPVCSIKSKLKNRRQNEHLEKRSHHIKDLIDAFRDIAATAEDIIGNVCIELDNTNETIFEPVPKLNHVYVNKRKNKLRVNLSDLPSVSQRESNLVFPGEAIDISADDQGKNNKPGSLENVKTWLESTQNNFSERTDSQVENMNVVNNIPITKINSLSEGACLAVNQSDWDKIEVLVDSENHNSDPSYNFVPADMSSNELRRSARNKVKDTDKVTTVMKSIKSANKIVTDQITIENYLEPTPIKANVSNNSNANSSSEKKLTSKKEMWSSVKKMKQDFNKINKRKVKKLNISIGSCKKSESVISKRSLPVVEDANIKPSPYIIEDSTPATPITISSNEKVIDKDRDACLQILYKSELNRTTDLSKSRSPLPYFDETDGAIKQHKLKPILNKNETDSKNDREASMEDLHGKIDDPIDNTLIGTNINTKSILSNSVANSDLPHVFLQEPNTVQEIKGEKKQTLQNKRWFPFIKRGKILGKCFYPNRKVPFYYKHQCGLPQKSMEKGNFVITVEKNNMKTYINISDTDVPHGHNSKVSLRRSTEIRQMSKKHQTEVYTYTRNELESMALKFTGDLAQPTIDTGNEAMKTDGMVNSLKSNQPTQSLKKATESADTATVTSTINAEKTSKHIERDDDVTDDCDMFNSGPIACESRNEMASGIIKQPSEIIRSTIHNIETQATEKDTEHNNITGSKKRCRSRSVSRSPVTKKYKADAADQEMENDDLSIVFVSEHALEKVNEKSVHEDSELMNYDEIIGKVFANIDAEIEENAKDEFTSNNMKEHISESQEKQDAEIAKDTNINLSPHNEIEINNVNKVYSENMFSTIHEKVPCFKTLQENDCIIEEDIGKQNPGGLSRNSKTELDVTTVSDHDLDEDHFIATPINTKAVTGGDCDGSDNNVVEDTPQKPKKSKLSISSAKSVSRDSQQNKDMSVDNRSVSSSLRMKRSIDKAKITQVKKSSSISREIRSLLNESVEDCETQKQSVTDLVDKISKEDIEVATPLNITKFSSDVKHNSTPMHPNARKLLDFNKQKMEKDENSQSGKENMAASFNNVDAKLLTRQTSLEKGMMQDMFIMPSQPSEATQRSGRGKFTLACSCLQTVQITNVKILALRKGWNYIDQYSSNLTHLIVAVDEKNISQRSVKYMRALAAGKWIVSYDWILQSLKGDKVINEAPYEVLDSTGSMGPKWSRTATKKLFTGITFFCMPPFTVLDERTLSLMLEDAGGTVVKTIEEITLKSQSISLLLAEPESTQEDRFIYIAACHSIVPVNFEWALNSLGCYELTSIRHLLLCPESLVHLDKLNWPKPLFDASSDELDDNTYE